MRVIITGGTGLIGTPLANSFAQDGHEVVVLSRSPGKARGLNKAVRVEQWDARTMQGWSGLADGVGAIINLAGESISGNGFLPSRWTPERKQRMRDSRLDAGKAVVEAIKEAPNKPPVLIQASAVGYYGTHGDEDITEEHPAGDDFLAGVCQEWEAGTAEVERWGVRRVIVRTGLVMTSRSGALPLMALPFRLFTGGPIGGGKQQIPWIHIDDEVRAIRFLIDTPSAKGVYNLSSPAPLSNEGFGKALGRALRRPSYLPLPATPFKVAFGEISMLMLQGQRAVPKRLQEAGFQFHYPEAEGALRDLFHNRK